MIFRLLGRLVPMEWRTAATELYRLKVLTRWQVVWIAGLTVITVGFESFGVAMLFPILDYVQADGDLAGLTADSRLWQIITDAYGLIGMPVSLLSLSATVFVLTLLRSITAYVHVVAVTQVRQNVGRKLMRRCFADVMSSHASCIQDLGTGSFAYLITVQCMAANVLIHTFTNLWTQIVTFAAYGVLVLATAPLAGLVAVAVAVAALACVTHYVRLSSRVSRRLVKTGEGFSQYLTDRYRAWRLIKLSDALPYENDLVARWTDRIYELSVSLARAGGRIELVITPLIILTILIALYVSVEFFDVSIAVITVFVIVLMRLMPVTRTFAKLRQSVAIGGANLERVVRAFEETAAARETDTGTRTFPGLADGIAFEDVSFSYGGGERAALRGVTTTIPAFSLTAITGPSGAGKSTMVDLLPRLLTPTAGDIRIDGVSLNDFTLSSLRSRIAFVPQEPLLLDASVLDNVRYGRADADMADVRRACALAYADEFIDRLPAGYDTELGEAGVRLSGGQRQRLVLARAFLADTSLLILDEPTSALDLESERKVRAALEAMVSEGRMTVIIIAHRLSTVRTADHLIVLKDGTLLAAGPPDEVRRGDNWYAAVMELDQRADAATAEPPVETLRESTA